MIFKKAKNFYKIHRFTDENHKYNENLLISIIANKKIQLIIWPIWLVWCI